MTKPDIRNWRDIDAPWLESVLAGKGFETKINSFTAGQVGTGQIGDCARFKIDYASAPDDAPRTLVGKFPAEGEESRATGVSLGNYHREVKFYQLLQPRARISTPDCFFTDVNEDTHDFVLMMEDLAPAEQGDQLQGVSLDMAKLVIGEAAKLHGAFWEDETLDDYHWVSGSRDAESPIQPELVAELWRGFVARYGDRITADARRIGDAMSQNLEGYETLREGPRTLVHADFRPDNMLFATGAGGKPVTIVDWQSFGYGPGAADVGYFIAGALDPALRKKHQDELLAGYVAELRRQGVSDYARADLERHYVAGAYQHFFTAFFAAMLVTQTPRGDDMFFKMLNGAVDLIMDHDASGWLD